MARVQICEEALSKGRATAKEGVTSPWWGHSPPCAIGGRTPLPNLVRRNLQEEPKGTTATGSDGSAGGGLAGSDAGLGGLRRRSVRVEASHDGWRKRRICGWRGRWGRHRWLGCRGWWDWRRRGRSMSTTGRGAIAATASEEEQRLMGEPNGEVGRGWGRSGGAWHDTAGAWGVGGRGSHLTAREGVVLPAEPRAGRTTGAALPLRAF
jgi:hypothetical protein